MGLGLWIGLLPDHCGCGESSIKFNNELKSAWSIDCTCDLCASPMGWKYMLLLCFTPLVDGSELLVCATGDG